MGIFTSIGTAGGTSSRLVLTGPHSIIYLFVVIFIKYLFTYDKKLLVVQKALISHWHHDHVDGIPDLLKICPEVTIYKHQPDEGQSNIEDGQVFQVDGATLKAHYTPGHAYDHMVFVLEEENAIFTADS